MRTSDYTIPLKGKPYYQSTGIIRVFDQNERLYNVGEITLERYDDQNFQYVFKPYWNVLDGLPDGVFHGIPGIDLDIKKNAYYRVNMTPSFISMRTPGESRENVRELMASVGLDYYDRFEWLLRTETRCGDDNLIVVRKPETAEKQNDLKKTNRRFLIPEDEIVLPSFAAFECSNAALIEEVYGLLQSGSRIYLQNEERYVGDAERKTMLYLLKNMKSCCERHARAQRATGIRKAKQKGVYRGRKPIEVDRVLLQSVYEAFCRRTITEKEAMRQLGLSSRSTFYRRIKDCRPSAGAEPGGQ